MRVTKIIHTNNVATQNGHPRRHVFAKHSLERFYNAIIEHYVKEVLGKQMVPCPEFKLFGRQNNMLKYNMQWTHFKGKSCCDECGNQSTTIKIIKRHEPKSLYMGFNYP